MMRNKEKGTAATKKKKKEEGKKKDHAHRPVTACKGRWLSPRLSLLHSHTLIHTRSHTLTHTHTHSLTRSLTHSLILCLIFIFFAAEVLGELFSSAH